MGLFDWFAKEDITIAEENYIQDKEKDFSNFKNVTDYIYTKSGIIDLNKRALTSSRLQQYAVDENIYTTDEFLHSMKNRDDFYQEVLNIATVNETYFLREIRELEWLVNYIKGTNKKLKILSMPCSSGEEIYSILLMLKQNNIDTSYIEIQGYDINSQAIEHAIKAIYDEHSLHKIDDVTKQNYFTLTKNNKYEISSQLQKNVTFTQKNIFDLEGEIQKYDIILSRNMFIYFDNENRAKALDIIANLLKPNGIYIKGHADNIKSHPNLESLEFGIYKKST